MDDRKVGSRFSHLYQLRSDPERDSIKARFRLAKLFEASFPSASSLRHSSSTDYNKLAQKKIESELGIRFATKSKSGNLVYSWEWYFARVSVMEMLDSITVVAPLLYRQYSSDERQAKFVLEAQRIFSEENLAYSIDELGGVHPLIDAAFYTAMASAISGLSGPRYTASVECLKLIEKCLLQEPQDFKGAIKAVFAACENTFKLMYDVPRLDSKAVADWIGPEQQKLYKNDSILQAVTAKTLDSFKQWINAAHFFRHEQGVEEPTQPTDEVAILLISQGLSFVRWLAAIDRLRMST